LKGDYLAIVTLGFGQIISRDFSQHRAARRRARVEGIPSYTNLFWAFVPPP
jgi:ABC-type branched-subunit amino acid transport system permease subunit